RATLNRFTSVNEQNYLRGVGITLNVGKNLKWSTFISSRQRDGNTIEVDTLNQEDAIIQNFTSLQLSGLHRTESEIANENTLRHFTVGSSWQFKTTKGGVGLNILYNQFDRPIGKSDRPANRYAFNGTRLINASLDYAYFYKNLVLFGETAWSDNGQIASVNGLIVPINTKVAFSIHQRYLPRNFHSLLGQTFSETTGTINENGIYLGLTVTPTRRWRFAAYADTWRHSWLRFRADAPSVGSEYFARLTYYKRRDLEVYWQWKYERKQQSYRLDYAQLDELLFNQKSNFRFQFNKKLTKRLELRSRLEWSIFDVEKSSDPLGLIFYNGVFRSQKEVRSTGFMAYQDIIYKPANIPFSLTTRFALFDVDNFDARIYAFENDVTYQFSIPAYYNQGSRFYAILKYRAKRHLIVETRYAQTYWANQTEFGSGNSRIEGQTRSEIRMQVRWRF
ncbi:MAG: helix-hairpin-helix domain-containing protein, partial [Bacteroidota bacterium]